MAWETVLQTITVSMAGLGAWFLYDLVREFKLFKKETKTDIFHLKQERLNFQNTVRNAELSMAVRVNEMKAVQNDYSLSVKSDLQDLKFNINQIKDDTQKALKSSTNYVEFLNKSLELCRTLNVNLKRHEEEIKSIKVQLENILIIKSK